MGFFNDDAENIYSAPLTEEKGSMFSNVHFSKTSKIDINGDVVFNVTDPDRYREPSFRPYVEEIRHTGNIYDCNHCTHIMSSFAPYIYILGSTGVRIWN